MSSPPQRAHSHAHQRFHPHPFQIYKVKANWNGCTDERPAIVVDEPVKGQVPVVYISGNMSLFNGRPNQMSICRQDTGYDQTKLPRDECFIDREQLHWHAVDSDFTKQYGALEGELLKRFLRWF